MRWLKTDAVPADLVRQLLEGAITAPNAGNQQAWRFIVVDDPAIKAAVQVYYAKALEDIAAAPTTSPPPGMSDSQYARQIVSRQHLTEHFHEAPLWIVGCIDHGGHLTSASGASIYPAVQNILLGARALGLGATLTTRHTRYAAEVDAIFGLPDHATALAIIPIGFPARPFGRVRRGPLDAVVYHDRWGTSWSPR
jgi:nitroreductase